MYTMLEHTNLFTNICIRDTDQNRLLTQHPYCLTLYSKYTTLLIKAEVRDPCSLPKMSNQPVNSSIKNCALVVIGFLSQCSNNHITNPW